MRTKFIEDACELITDGTHYTPPNIGAGFPFLTVKDMTTEGLDFINCSHISHSEYIKADAGNSSPKSGDVLFSKDGTVGKVHVVSEKKVFAILSSIAILRPRKDILDSTYFGYVLRSPVTLNQAVRRKTGSAIRRIILKDLKRVKIPLPPLAEQKRIAAILDQADAVRRKRKEAIALTEELLRSTFLDMFGDPVTNPKGWKVGKLQEVCNRVTDGTHQSPQWSIEGVPFLFVSNIVNGEIDFNVSKYITEECWESLTERCPIELNDILYTTVGSYGNAALVRTTRKFCFQRHIAHIKPDLKKVNPEFLLGLMQSPGVKSQADRQVRGIAQKTLNLRELKAFKIVIPPRNEQDKYAKIRRQVESSLSFCRECYEFQNHLFNSLLQKAFRGEL